MFGLDQASWGEEDIKTFLKKNISQTTGNLMHFDFSLHVSLLQFLIVACKDHWSTSKLPNICFQKDGIDFLTFHLFF